MSVFINYFSMSGSDSPNSHVLD